METVLRERIEWRYVKSPEGGTLPQVIRSAANRLYEASARDLITLRPNHPLFVHTVLVIFRAPQLFHRCYPYSGLSFMVICFSDLDTSESTLKCDSTSLI